MRYVILFSLFFISLNQNAQSGREKIAWKLDSIIKAEKLTKIGIYFHAVDVKPYDAIAKEVFVEYFEEFKFDGALLLLIDPNKEVRYYNLDKVIHWTIKSKEKILKLYFQI